MLIIFLPNLGMGASPVGTVQATGEVLCHVRVMPSISADVDVRPKVMASVKVQPSIDAGVNA